MAYAGAGLGHSFTDLGHFSANGSGSPNWHSPFENKPFEALDRSGQQRLLLLSGVPIFNSTNGGFAGVRGSARDVTESRQAEQRLIAARNEAEFANHSKSEFLANMSHELRTPLNAIIGFAEMMLSEIFGRHSSPKYGEYAADIEHSANHLLRIIDDILDLSKIEAGQFELQPLKLVAAEAIASCLRLLRHRAQHSGVQLIEKVESDLTLVADPRLLRQILINLLSNAIKFTPSGGSVTISAQSGPQGSWLIAVSDTGIGIAAEHMEEILKPFVRVGNAFNANVEGTGLGLPLVKSYVELLGGSLEIESTPGVGTTVRLHFAAQASGEDE